MSSEKQLIEEIESLMRLASSLSSRIQHFSHDHRSYFAMNRAWSEMEDARDFLYAEETQRETK